MEVLGRHCDLLPGRGSCRSTIVCSVLGSRPRAASFVAPTLCSLPPPPPCFPLSPSLPLPSLQSSALVAANLMPEGLIITIVPISPCAWIRDCQCPHSHFPLSRFPYSFLVLPALCIPLPLLPLLPLFLPPPVPSPPLSNSADLADSVGPESSWAVCAAKDWFLID